MGDHRHKKKISSDFFLNNMILWSHARGFTQDYKPAVFSNDSKVVNPTVTGSHRCSHEQTWQTNLEDDQCRQLAVLACVMFKNDENLGGDKNMGQLLWNRCVLQIYADASLSAPSHWLLQSEAAQRGMSNMFFITMNVPTEAPSSFIRY